MNENNSIDPIMEFKQERQQEQERMAKDKELKNESLEWLIHTSEYQYVYNFSWLGRPIIQLPTDIIAMQEIIWQVKPDLIIETGIAHGGSIIFSASMLELIGGEGEVVGIDIDIRKHNRSEIENHSMMKRINLIEGSSIDESVIRKVEKIAENKKKIMVFLDSCHTHEHVMNELDLYSKFVSVGSYIVAFDTIVELLPNEFQNDRPWGVGNNPMTAVKEFIEKNNDFVIEHSIENKLLMTSAPSGYLKRIR